MTRRLGPPGPLEHRSANHTSRFDQEIEYESGCYHDRLFPQFHDPTIFDHETEVDFGTGPHCLTDTPQTPAHPLGGVLLTRRWGAPGAGVRRPWRAGVQRANACIQELSGSEPGRRQASTVMIVQSIHRNPTKGRRPAPATPADPEGRSPASGPGVVPNHRNVGGSGARPPDRHRGPPGSRPKVGDQHQPARGRGGS